MKKVRDFDELQDRENHDDWVKSTVKFKLDGKPVQFEIIHNLKSQGYSIENVLPNWFPRTDVFTAKSLVDYINSKSHMTQCYAMTIEQYEEKNK